MHALVPLSKEMCNKFVFISYSLLIINYFEYTNGIKCYQCSPMRVNEYYGNKVFDCDDFHMKLKNIIDCPSSTMCTKKIHVWEFPIGETRLTTRGCARQSEELQELINNNWTFVNHIREVYNSGCKVIKHEEKSSEETECYCRGDLCNDATNYEVTRIVIISAVIFALVVR